MLQNSMGALGAFCLAFLVVFGPGLSCHLIGIVINGTKGNN